VELEGGAHRALGVVLVGDRGAEERQHGVADDLVDPSTERLDVLHQPLEAPVDQPLDLLGIAMLRQGGEPHDVGEQHGDHPPLVPPHLQVGAAVGAEPRTVGNVGAAVGAGHAAQCTDRSE
jgi:hypothetical protein